MSEFLTTASNQFEAQIICERLAEAGIQALVQGGFDDKGILAGTARDIYVNDDDVGRARDALSADEGFSEEELTRLSEEAVEEE